MHVVISHDASKDTGEFEEETVNFRVISSYCFPVALQLPSLLQTWY